MANREIKIKEASLPLRGVKEWSAPSVRNKSRHVAAHGKLWRRTSTCINDVTDFRGVARARESLFVVRVLFRNTDPPLIAITDPLYTTQSRILASSPHSHTSRTHTLSYTRCHTHTSQMKSALLLSHTGAGGGGGGGGGDFLGPLGSVMSGPAASYDGPFAGACMTLPALLSPIVTAAVPRGELPARARDKRSL